MHDLNDSWTFLSVSKEREVITFAKSDRTDGLRVPQVARSHEMAIFLSTTTDDCGTLTCACARCNQRNTFGIGTVCTLCTRLIPSIYPSMRTIGFSHSEEDMAQVLLPCEVDEWWEDKRLFLLLSHMRTIKDFDLLLSSHTRKGQEKTVFFKRLTALQGLRLFLANYCTGEEQSTFLTSTLPCIAKAASFLDERVPGSGIPFLSNQECEDIRCLILYQPFRYFCLLQLQHWCWVVSQCCL